MPNYAVSRNPDSMQAGKRCQSRVPHDGINRHRRTEPYLPLLVVVPTHEPNAEMTIAIQPSTKGLSFPTAPLSPPLLVRFCPLGFDCAKTK